MSDHIPEGPHVLLMQPLACTGSFKTTTAFACLQPCPTLHVSSPWTFPASSRSASLWEGCLFSVHPTYPLVLEASSPSGHTASRSLWCLCVTWSQIWRECERSPTRKDDGECLQEGLSVVASESLCLCANEPGRYILPDRALASESCPGWATHSPS